MDKEFIDGAMISRFKRVTGSTAWFLEVEHACVMDALGISKLEKASWVKYEEVKDESGRS